ncbi:hypothetical protein BE24_05410 [Staphylococcus xylosus]|uniref:hypothetical protein n=1 Tax=Staphylococcus xylosus TaxID=1288 RepID=UPI00049B32D3|nr:hypothetical protein [Staphylococcus xylosus]AID01530.1 hypothetical protein BE24_05410 [Staphylococcus xylosus]MDW4303877.1 hypothetical protein [Staphylococcus saprophyticus]
MKIKTKKQLNLPQLIEWAMGNNVDNSIFVGKKNLYNVGFNKNGLMYFNTTKPIPTGEIFTVTTEEEIMEDTRLDELVVRYRNDDIYIFPQERINDFKNDSSIVAFYIPNDDLTLTLIWTREKGLVE